LPAVEKWLFSSAGRNRAGDERYTVGEEPGRVDDCGEEDGSRSTSTSSGRSRRRGSRWAGRRRWKEAAARCQMREGQFWGLKADGAGKEARAGPTCQHPWRTHELYASGAEIPEAYNTGVRLRCWHVGPAT
jgi:hypothetical protein